MRNPTPRARRRGSGSVGFTLVEVLIVVTIAGILATLAFEEGAEMIRTAKAQAAGSQVTLALQRARQWAVVEKVPFFVRVVTANGVRVENIEILRDDGSGILEVGTDTVVQAFVPEIAVFLGDGQGNTTDLPVIAADEFGLAFGLRGEARDPLTRDLVSAFINVGTVGAERGGWMKYSQVAIQPAGAIQQTYVREHG